MNNYLHSAIVNYVEGNIKNQTLKEGDKIPSERELAAQFQVSRNVIREGINILREKGLIEVHPGRGAYVTKPDPLMITSTMERILQNYDTTIEDVLEVREELELSIIGKAVKAAEPNHIRKLYSLYNLMDKHQNDVNLFIKFDIQFHVTLARATDNQLFVILLNSFVEMTDRVLFALTRMTPETIEQAQSQHLKIIQSIEEKDEHEAKEVIIAHMHVVRDDIKLLRGKKLF
ncbi:FadR/GntR family transcriptional regulator [Virgibacillus oceani]